MTAELSKGMNGCFSEHANDRMSSALHFVQSLLEFSTAPASLEALLEGLAQAFGGTGAGLAGPLDSKQSLQVRWRIDGQPSQPLRGPWEERPELLLQARTAPAALPVRTAAGDNLLLTVVVPQQGSGWLLWLENESGGDWGNEERAAWTLAGQALARLLTAGGEGGWIGRLQRKNLQLRLEQAAALVAWLSHDFGNVLTGVLGFAELCLAQLPAGTPPHRFVSEIQETAKRGAEFVRKLRLFSGAGRGASGVASLASVAGEEASRLKPAWQPRVELHLAVPADLPLVAIDVDSLRQVLAHLLDNAYQGIKSVGRVTLTARRIELTERDRWEWLGDVKPGPAAEITVADNGGGFSPEARRELFAEPFFSSKPRHHGLGLPIVYGLLQAHGGGLDIDLFREKGAVVRVVVPLAVAPAAAVTEPLVGL